MRLDLSLSLGSAALNTGGALMPLFSANLVDEIYYVDRAEADFATAFDFTRASSGLAQNSTGAFESFSTNEARLTDIGLLIEAAGTNHIRNSSGNGASAPSTYPTNWSNFFGGGVSCSVLGSGSEGGLPYVDFRVSGTASSTSGGTIRFETTTGVDALSGEEWTVGLFARIVGGSVAGLTNVRQLMLECTEAGGGVTTGTGDSFAGDLSATRQRFEYTRTLAGGGTVAHMQHRLEFTYNSGSAISLDIRLYVPQNEKAGALSSPILTTSAAVTRAADALTCELPAGDTTDLVFTHDDLSTTPIADVAAGDYALDPDDLSRPLVTRIDWGSV